MLKVVAQARRLFLPVFRRGACPRRPQLGAAASTDGEVGPRRGLCVEGSADPGAGPSLLLLLHRHHLLQQMADKGDWEPAPRGGREVAGPQCPSYLTAGRHGLQPVTLVTGQNPTASTAMPGILPKYLHRGEIRGPRGGAGDTWGAYTTAVDQPAEKQFNPLIAGTAILAHAAVPWVWAMGGAGAGS